MGTSASDYVRGIFNLPKECVSVDVYTANSTDVAFLTAIHDDKSAAHGARAR